MEVIPILGSHWSGYFWSHRKNSWFNIGSIESNLVSARLIKSVITAKSFVLFPCLKTQKRVLKYTMIHPSCMRFCVLLAELRICSMQIVTVI